MQRTDTTKSIWPRTFLVLSVVCAATVGVVLVARPAPLSRRIKADAADVLAVNGELLSTRWTYIVVHDSRSPSGSAKAFDVYYREVLDQPDGMGWHFLIRRGATGGSDLVDVGSRWRLQQDGYHVFNRYDQEAIGVCLVGNFRRQRPTAEQMKALAWLVRSLQRRCRIPPERVRLHRELVPGSSCPGTQFPAEEFRQSLLSEFDTDS